MQSEPPNNQKILIVDDNPKNLQVLGKLLQAESFDIEFAINGSAALDWLVIKEFDLILLDINMPGMDGFTVCEQIRSKPEYADMPVIFLTAQVDRESILKGFETGAQDYILKPFDSRELLARVKTQLEIKRSHDHIRRYLEDIERKNKLIRESIDYASAIQNAFQHAAQLGSSQFRETFSLLLPKDVLSGDFFFYNQSGSMITAGVFDGTGHGIPGAFMSILGITYLNEIYEREGYVSPEKVLEKVRNKIITAFNQKGDILEISNGMDGALISIDMKTRKAYFSGAFNSVYLLRNGSITELKGDRMPLAYHSQISNFTLKITDVFENDILYLFTDGFPDQFGGPENKKYGRTRFREDILKVHTFSLEAQKQYFLENFLEWKGSRDQTDDITVIALKL